MTTEDTNIITDPLFAWTLRGDGAISVYVTDGNNSQTKIVMATLEEFGTLQNVVEVATQAREIYDEHGFEAADAAVRAMHEREAITFNDDTIRKLLDGT